MRSFGLSVAFVLVLAAQATAQPTPGNCPHPTTQRAAPSPALLAARRAEHQACAADLTKFCAKVPRGCGRPMQCLRAHTAELSSVCTSAIAQLHAARQPSHPASPVAPR
jgi:hypothetical protein